MSSSVGSSSSSTAQSDFDWREFLASPIQEQRSPKIEESPPAKKAKTESTNSCITPSLFESTLSTYILDGNYQKALDLLDLFTTTLDTNPNLLSKRGIALYKLGRNEAALNSFNEALELDPQCLEAYHYKIRVLNELERFDEAFQNIKSFDERFPIFKQAKIWDPDILYLEFRMHFKNENWIEVQASLEKLRKHFPQSLLLQRANRMYSERQLRDARIASQLIAPIPVTDPDSTGTI